MVETEYHTAVFNKHLLDLELIKIITRSKNLRKPIRSFNASQFVGGRCMLAYAYVSTSTLLVGFFDF